MTLDSTAEMDPTSNDSRSGYSVPTVIVAASEAAVAAWMGTTTETFFFASHWNMAMAMLLTSQGDAMVGASLPHGWGGLRKIKKGQRSNGKEKRRK